MGSGWAAAMVAFAGLVGVLGGRIWAGGRKEGKIDTILENLQRIVADHETRLRKGRL